MNTIRTVMTATDSPSPLHFSFSGCRKLAVAVMHRAFLDLKYAKTKEDRDSAQAFFKSPILGQYCALCKLNEDVIYHMYRQIIHTP